MEEDFVDAEEVESPTGLCTGMGTLVSPICTKSVNWLSQAVESMLFATKSTRIFISVMDTQLKYFIQLPLINRAIHIFKERENS